jgi:hypothetical protein
VARVELTKAAEQDLDFVKNRAGADVAQAIADFIYRDMNHAGPIAPGDGGRIADHRYWRRCIVEPALSWYVEFHHDWSSLRDRYVVRRIWSTEQLVEARSRS